MNSTPRDAQAPSHRECHLPSVARTPSVTKVAPAKKITFLKRGDPRFAGVRLAVHQRAFKTFSALMDELSQRVPLSFGVRSVTTPRGLHSLSALEQLEDGGCYLCSDKKPPKTPSGLGPPQERNPTAQQLRDIEGQREAPGTSSSRKSLKTPRRILLIKNMDPRLQQTVVLSHRNTRNLAAFLSKASDLLRFPVKQLYTTSGKKVDSLQALLHSPSVLVCAGHEAFRPPAMKNARRSEAETLSGLTSRNKNGSWGPKTKPSVIHSRSPPVSRLRLTERPSPSNPPVGPARDRHPQDTPVQPGPLVAGDDMKKKVRMNEDGSLSVEMKVRFHLVGEDTLLWSRRMGRASALTAASGEDPVLGEVDPLCCVWEGYPWGFSEPGVWGPRACRVGCREAFGRGGQPGPKYEIWTNPLHASQGERVAARKRWGLAQHVRCSGLWGRGAAGRERCSQDSASPASSTGLPEGSEPDSSWCPRTPEDGVDSGSPSAQIEAERKAGGSLGDNPSLCTDGAGLGSPDEEGLSSDSSASTGSHEGSSEWGGRPQGCPGKARAETSQQEATEGGDPGSPALSLSSLRSEGLQAEMEGQGTEQARGASVTREPLVPGLSGSWDSEGTSSTPSTCASSQQGRRRHRSRTSAMSSPSSPGLGRVAPRGHPRHSHCCKDTHSPLDSSVTKQVPRPPERRRACRDGSVPRYSGSSSSTRIQASGNLRPPSSGSLPSQDFLGTSSATVTPAGHSDFASGVSPHNAPCAELAGDTGSRTCSPAPIPPHTSDSCSKSGAASLGEQARDTPQPSSPSVLQVGQPEQGAVGPHQSRCCSQAGTQPVQEAQWGPSPEARWLCGRYCPTPPRGRPCPKRRSSSCGSTSSSHRSAARGPGGSQQEEGTRQAAPRRPRAPFQGIEESSASQAACFPTFLNSRACACAANEDEAERDSEEQRASSNLEQLAENTMKEEEVQLEETKEETEGEGLQEEGVQLEESKETEGLQEEGGVQLEESKTEGLQEEGGAQLEETKGTEGEGQQEEEGAQLEEVKEGPEGGLQEEALEEGLEEEGLPEEGSVHRQELSEASSPDGKGSLEDDPVPEEEAGRGSAEACPPEGTEELTEHPSHLSETDPSASESQSGSQLDPGLEKPPGATMMVQEHTRAQPTQGAAERSSSVACRAALDCDPIWVSVLLKKTEKAFLAHLASAVAELRARWGLQDNDLLDQMAAELQQDVAQRLQDSTKRELQKLQGRAGRVVLEPPREALSGELLLQTQQRRHRLRGLRNLSAFSERTLGLGPLSFTLEDEPALSTALGSQLGEEAEGEEFCPCEACVRKKVSPTSPKTTMGATRGPIKEAFDLQQILQRKRGEHTDGEAAEVAPGKTHTDPKSTRTVQGAEGGLGLGQGPGVDEGEDGERSQRLNSDKDPKLGEAEGDAMAQEREGKTHNSETSAGSKPGEAEQEGEGISERGETGGQGSGHEDNLQGEVVAGGDQDPGQSDEAEGIEALEAEGEAQPESEGVEAQEAKGEAQPESEGMDAQEAEKEAQPESEGVEAPEAEEEAQPESEGVEAPEAEKEAQPETESLEAQEAEGEAQPESEGVGAQEAEKEAQPEAESVEAQEAEKEAQPETEKSEGVEAQEAEKEAQPETENAGGRRGGPARVRRYRGPGGEGETQKTEGDAQPKSDSIEAQEAEEEAQEPESEGIEALAAGEEAQPEPEGVEALEAEGEAQPESEVVEAPEVEGEMQGAQGEAQPELEGETQGEIKGSPQVSLGDGQSEEASESSSPVPEDRPTPPPSPGGDTPHQRPGSQTGPSSSRASSRGTCWQTDSENDHVRGDIRSPDAKSMGAPHAERKAPRMYPESSTSEQEEAPSGPRTPELGASEGCDLQEDQALGSLAPTKPVGRADGFGQDDLDF
uniref:Retinitis pigmentosa 1-like 1 protein n=1 Tax=Nomascus leucogenys TaxID=61853 RepID=G1RYB5_NOMLE